MVGLPSKKRSPNLPKSTTLNRPEVLQSIDRIDTSSPITHPRSNVSTNITSEDLSEQLLRERELQEKENELWGFYHKATHAWREELDEDEDTEIFQHTPLLSSSS